MPVWARRRARSIVATAAGAGAVALAGKHIRRIEAAIAAELGATALAGVRAGLARIPAAIADRPAAADG